MTTRGEIVARDYAAVAVRLDTSGDREARMRRVADALWDAFSSKGVSWIGFYLKVAGKDEMVLGPSRDKPACSPIGLHGCCGRSYLERRAIVVEDVASLGAGYIACDPRDRSEAVVPLFEKDGTCWGVLDADSYEVGAFGEADVRGLRDVVVRAGLSLSASPLESLRL
jgi:L-methionine (R)-S-oxide reductase